MLTGLRDQLCGMLARLQEKEEVLLLGWGVKMPIPIKSRRYDEQFYRDIKGLKTVPILTEEDNQTNLKALNDDLFG